MTVGRTEIREALGQMPVLELVELIKELEEEWGVSAAAAVVAGSAAPAEEAGRRRGADRVHRNAAELRLFQGWRHQGPAFD